MIVKNVTDNLICITVSGKDRGHHKVATYVVLPGKYMDLEVIGLVKEFGDDDNNGNKQSICPA